MDLSWMVRARWRLVGAWMWPAFAALAIADGFIGHALPAFGDAASVVAGVVVGGILNLVAVTAFALPVGLLLRRRRRDLPLAIARNYGGTLGVALVTAGFVALGLLNESSIAEHDRIRRDATVRAAAYIGDHAPPAFRADASRLDVVAIQQGSVYRACVSDSAGTRHYCVIVKEHAAEGRSVVPDGSESNEDLARDLQ